MELVMELGTGIDRAEMCQGDFDLEVLVLLLGF